MGYNSGILILNDAIGQLQDDAILKEWWRRMEIAIISGAVGVSTIDIPVGNHVNASTLFHMGHADMTGIYALGGNHISRLLLTTGDHHTKECQIALLRELANKMGFDLVEKS